MTNTFTRDPLPQTQYNGDGSRTVFPFSFEVLASDDLLVYIDSALATGFGIGGIGAPDGGEVTFAEAPAAGTTVTLLRRTESIRETEFIDGGPFRAASINAELDRLTFLIQENREEQVRTLRGHPEEAELDFCLPATADRVNKLLGFDSTGQPVAFEPTELPSGGDASGLIVTPTGAITGRSLGEHLATPVDVRDYGAIGDGVTDDSAAFAAAITAAQTRSATVYVPASATPYLLGTGLVLTGTTMIGDGAGSVIKASIASGFGIQLAGNGAALRCLRILGPGAASWPASAADVDLSGVTVDGVQVAAGAEDALVDRVEIAACEAGLGVDGQICAILNSSFQFHRQGIEFRSGSAGSVFVTASKFTGCTNGIRTDSAATVAQLSLSGGTLEACNRGLDLPAPTSAWRTVELSGLSFSGNLDADLDSGPRQSLALRSAQLDPTGKRNGAAIELSAAGETVEAPNLIVENTFAETTAVVAVQLSGGTNLNLLTPGDLIVLDSDVDDVDDLWTSLKATRGGVVHKVNAQTTTTADLELAVATTLPLLAASDVIRVVGRFGTANVDSVGASGPASDFTWLRADDYCRVFAANNPMPADQIEVLGTNADLRQFPGIDATPVTLSGVELFQQSVNGALLELQTFLIAQDTAISFPPKSAVGMLHMFTQGTLGDAGASIFTYRAEALGYTQIVAAPGTSNVEVAQLTALTGTTGNPNVITVSANDDGLIYVENRLAGPPRPVNLFVVGAPV